VSGGGTTQHDLNRPRSANLTLRRNQRQTSVGTAPLRPAHPPPLLTASRIRRSASKILPPWCRKSPKVSEVLPLLYLHGLSGDFVPALEQFLGSAAGLSPATMTRLTKQWQDDHAAFQQLGLADSDYVYVWADGVHSKVRLGQAHSCVLVLMGVRLDGTKELIALAEGLRESTESWADLLRDCRRRGMRDPELVVGDGAMGLWKALAEVFPAARHQRCWVHQGPECHERPAEVRAAGRDEGDAGDLQRRGPRARRGVREDLRHQVPQGRREDHRRPRRVAGFLRLPGRALDPLADDEPDRVDLLHRQAPHQGHPRPGSPAAALAMVFKLVESAQARWWAITGAHLVAPVRSGARFENGVLVERREDAAA
jgi:putative transposase